MKLDLSSAVRDSSLNCKSGVAIPGEPINANLKDHALETADWEHREIAKALYDWATIFNTEFHLDLPVPAIQVASIARRAFGTYREERNGFGIHHEITINTEHLDRPSALVFCTLFHELLHQWQLLYGKPGRGNYHNRQFKHKASLYGLIVDSHGYTSVEPGRFTSLLTKYGIELTDLPTPAQGHMLRFRGNSKMRKYRCGCTTVRCAVELLARCDRCGQRFLEAPPSW
jgi:hypothetical protein